MWTRTLLKRNKKILEQLFRGYVVSASPFQIERALVLSKMTKYEVEKHCNPGLSDNQLERVIRSRGSDYDSLMKHHWRHKNFEQLVLEKLKSNGVKTKLLTSLNYSDSLESCGAVISVGGDGTFLLAAGCVRKRNIPVIGFNSDPDHSEGFLCLSRQHSVDDVLKRFKDGSFCWMYRTRIRVTINSKSHEPPVKLHDLIIGRNMKKSITSQEHVPFRQPTPLICQPILALNEVFVGEQLSAQVSYFELWTESQEKSRVKNSGICVSTGTGSTSWHLSMNRITKEVVAQVLNCAGLPRSQYQSDMIADKYNQSLRFDPEEMKMCYTIRDISCRGIWPSPPGLAPRAFASTLWIRSLGKGARLVIDGGTLYTFNDGCEATFQLKPEDALKTVVL